MTQQSDSNPVLAQLFSLANTWSVPIVKQLQETPTGKATTQAVNQARLNEIAQHSLLNGSGPADPRMAIDSAPNSLQDFISGTINAPVAAVTKNPSGILVFVLIAVVVWMFLKNR